MRNQRKWTEEDREQVYELFRSGALSQRKLAKQYGTSVSYIRRFVKYYEQHGCFSARQGVAFMVTFKLEVVRYKQENHLSLLETALHFGLSESTVKSWSDRYQDRGATGLNRKKRMAKKKSHASLESSPATPITLKQCLELLEIENAYLKKLYALIHGKPAPSIDDEQKPSKN